MASSVRLLTHAPVSTLFELRHRLLAGRRRAAVCSDGGKQAVRQKPRSLGNFLHFSIILLVVSNFSRVIHFAA